MSVINNALRELESRPSVLTRLEASPALVAKALPHKRSHLWRTDRAWVWVPGLALLVFMVVESLQYWFAAQENNVIPATEAVQGSLVNAVLPTSPVVNEPAASPVLLGVQLRESRDTFELVFKFAGDVQASLISKQENHYVFLFQEASLALNQPRIAANSWLDSITLEKGEKGVELALTARDGVFVETHERVQAPNISWSLLLRASPGLDDRRITSVSPVPTSEISSGAERQADSERISTGATMRLEIRQSDTNVDRAVSLQAAQTHIQAGQNEPAESILRRMIEGENDRGARQLLIELLLQQGRYAELEPLLGEGRRLYPRDRDFAVLDAGILLRKGHYRQLVERYHDFGPDRDMLNLLGTGLQRLEQHEAAVEALRDSLNIDVRQPRVWVSLGISQQQTRQPEAALSSYRMAQRHGLSQAQLKSFVDKRIAQLSSQ